jgi:hypothetical protein
VLRLQIQYIASLRGSQLCGYALLGATILSLAVVVLFFEAPTVFPEAPAEILRSLFTVALCLAFLSPVGLPLGWTLAAGRKRLVLFLRRFGNEQLNDAVRDLVQTTLRRHYRLVTLDDSNFAPLGPRWRGLFFSLIIPISVCVLIFLPLSELIRLVEGEVRGETGMAGFLVAVLWLLLLFAAISIVAAVILIGLALRSHFTARRAIRDSTSLRRVLRRLRDLKSMLRGPSIAAPMAMVVTSTDSEWQRVVSAFAEVCDVALVDISFPTPSLCWEVEELRKHPIQVILLIARTAAGSTERLSSSNDSEHWVARMNEVAAGLPTVVYDRAAALASTDLRTLLVNRVVS